MNVYSITASQRHRNRVPVIVHVNRAIGIHWDIAAAWFGAGVLATGVMYGLWVLASGAWAWITEAM